MELSLWDWLVLSRPLLEILGGLLLVAFFYWPGRWILRFLTNGRYPPAWSKEHDVEFVAWIAVAVFLIGLTAYYS